MDNRQARTLDAFRKVIIYFSQHPITPVPPLLTRQLTSLEQSVNRIQKLWNEQLSGHKEPGSGPVVRMMSLRLRRKHLMPLVRIARPLLKFAPGIEPLMRVPHTRADAQELARYTLSLARALTRHSALLGDAGYTKTYLAELRREAKLLSTTAKHAERARDRKAKATLALAREFRNGMETVTTLEGLVMAHHYENGPALNVWRRTRRVPGRIGRPKVRKGNRASAAAGVR